MTCTVVALAAVALGSLSVVSTSGTSMEPTLHQGDLVVVRTSDYDVGDVVAYPSRSGATVLHRIVDRRGAELTLQGDNNDWVDPERPLRSEVIGEKWFHVPSAGKALIWLRGPLPISAFVAALGMMVTRSSVPSTRTRRAHRRAPSFARRIAARRPPRRDHATRRHARPVLLGALAVLASAVVLGAVSFSRPTTRVQRTQRSFSHHGTLSYDAAAPEGPVYESERIRTGDPVFMDLTDTLDVAFEYRLAPGPLRDVDGSAALSLELAAGNGWQRTIPLGEAPIDGTEASVDAVVDLTEVRRLLGEVESATGVRSSSYSVAFAAAVELTARAADRPVERRFDSRYQLQLDQKQLRPTTEAEPVVTDGVAVVPTTTTGTVPVEVERDGSFSVLGVTVGVAVARAAAVALAGAALVIAVSAALLLRGAGPRSESERTASRHRRRIVEVDGGEAGDAHTIIDVASAGALFRLADHHDRLVMHHRSPDGDTFLVDADETLYRYRMSPDRG